MLIHVVFSNSIQRDFHPEVSEDALQMTYCLENPRVLFLEHIVSGMRLGSCFLPYLHLHWHFLIEQRLCWWACLISKSLWDTRKCWWPLIYRTWSLLSSTPEKWGGLWSASSSYWGISTTDYSELCYILENRPYETRDFICKVQYSPLTPSLGDFETLLSC